MKNLNAFQQVCLQSFAAGTAGQGVGFGFVLQAALDELINTLMTEALYPYGWKITWGPRVWKSSWNPLQGVDNAWYVAEASNVKFPDGVIGDACVVSIAGTATLSAYDWLVEDFGVNKVVQFDDWTTSWTADHITPPRAAKLPTSDGAYASYGTCIGLYQLLTNASPRHNPGAGLTIVQYLQTLPSTTRVIITGHSLGGALAPALAYGLKNAGLLKGETYVLPLAGASPGNKIIAKGYNSDFKAIIDKENQVWNKNIYNSLDIVPQGWCIGPKECPDRNLRRILTIYKDISSPQLAVRVRNLVAFMEEKAAASGIAYYPIQGISFSRKPVHKIANQKKLMKEILYQHVKAYYVEAGVEEYMKQLYHQFFDFKGVAKRRSIGMKTLFISLVLFKLWLLSLPLFKACLPSSLFVHFLNLGQIEDTIKDSCPYDCILEDEEDRIAHAR